MPSLLSLHFLFISLLPANNIFLECFSRKLIADTLSKGYYVPLKLTILEESEIEIEEGPEIMKMVCLRQMADPSRSGVVCNPSSNSLGESPSEVDCPNKATLGLYIALSKTSATPVQSHLRTLMMAPELVCSPEKLIMCDLLNMFKNSE